MAISISIVGACWLIFLVYWGVSALNTKKSVIKRNWRFRWILVIIVIFAIAFINRGNSFDKIVFGNLLFATTPIISAVAAICAVAGVSVAIWARIYLGRNWSGYVTYKKNHELVTSGPYKYIRHPIYSGVLLMLVGTWLFLPTLWTCALLALYISIFLWRTKKEEAIMIKLFGKKYRDYMKHTKAIIPGVW